MSKRPKSQLQAPRKAPPIHRCNERIEQVDVREKRTQIVHYFNWGLMFIGLAALIHTLAEVL